MEQSKESARDWIEKNHPDKIELYEAIKETFDRFYICFTEAICEDGILFTYPLVLEIVNLRKMRRLLSN